MELTKKKKSWRVGKLKFNQCKLLLLIRIIRSDTIAEHGKYDLFSRSALINI